MDLIDRQVAIDAVLSIGHIAKLTDGDAVIRMSAVNYVLRNLASTEPEEDTIEMQEADIDETMKRLRDSRVTIPLSVQPEIVYCRDCKHWLHEHLCIELSKYGTIETLPNEFCSRAERREDASSR